MGFYIKLERMHKAPANPRSYWDDSFALRDSFCKHFRTLTPEGRRVNTGRRVGWGQMQFCSSAESCYSEPGSHHRFRTKKPTQSSLRATLSAVENTLSCLINTQEQLMPSGPGRLRRGRAGAPDCMYHNASRGDGSRDGRPLGSCGTLGGVVYLRRAAWRLKAERAEEGTTTPIGPCVAGSV